MRFANLNTVYEVHDPLHTVSIMLFISGSLVIVGPYVEKEWGENAGQDLLCSLHIPATTLNAYNLYRSKFTVLDTGYVMRAVAAMAEMEKENFSEYHYIKIDNTLDAKAMDIDIPDKYNYKHAMDGFVLENEFVQASGYTSICRRKRKNCKTFNEPYHCE